MTEISLETTHHVRDTCLCMAAQRAARALARRFDEAFRPFNLTNGQFSLMMALNRPEPPSITPVADFMAMDRTTLTAALKPLERRGLISVSVDPMDRRGRRLKLTAKGRSLLAKALPVWRDAHRRLEQESGVGRGLRAELDRLARSTKQTGGRIRG
jgi:DNA-binding MarR family transcriptional regulator